MWNGPGGPPPDGCLRVGIVGSRRRNTLNDRLIVFNLVKRLVRENLGYDVIIVSGGCPKGADSFAEEAAKVLGLQMIIHPIPRNPPIVDKRDFVARAFGRNLLVVKDSDVIYALRHPDGSGGTENAIKHARDLKKKTYEVDERGECLLIVEGNSHDEETTD